MALETQLSSSVSTTKGDKHRLIVNGLRQRIQDGDILPGERLGSFAALGSEFQATSTTINRALAVLEREGYIVRERGSGIYVNAKSSKAAPLVIGFTGIPTADPAHYWSRLFAGLRGGAHDYGETVALIPAAQNAGNLDGIIGHADSYDPNVLSGYSKPIVWMMIPRDGVASVVPDDMTAGLLATNYLQELGHKRIATMLQRNAREPLLRRAGYEFAHGAHRCEIDDRLRYDLKTGAQLGVRPDEVWSQTGYLSMRTWLADGWRSLNATAIIAQNDECAIGVIRALAEGGYSVPRDVSVVGFDGTEMGAFVTPSLTSVEIPIQEIAALAMEKLLRMVSGKNVSPTSVALQPRLVVRSSCAPPPQ